MEAITLMKRLEGLELVAYDCTSGKRSCGIGFNMEAVGARKVWSKLRIQENFDDVFDRKIPISEETAAKLFYKTWKWCEKKAKERCTKLGVDYDSLPEWHSFILADIVYNTGSIHKWTKVVKATKYKDVLLEARRRPHELMDSRVAKIAKAYGFVNTVEEARELGLTYARYV